MPEPTDAALVAALALAEQRAVAALDALQDVSGKLEGTRGVYWGEGAGEIARGEGAARQALRHARTAGALLRHSLATEPLKLQRML